MDDKERKQKLEWMRGCVRSMAARYGKIGINDPDDIAQNAMICLLKNRNCFELGAGWISKVVRNNALDALRRYGKEKSKTHVPKHVPGDIFVAEARDFEEYCASSASELHDLRIDLLNTLAGLQKPMMHTLWLFSQGYSCKEIAVITGANRSTVRTRLYYGRKAAQALLINAGIVEKR